MSGRVLRVHPDVLGVDLRDALAYYDSIDGSLGDRLAGAMVDAISRIDAYPRAFPAYVGVYRRVVLVPFPYMLVFSVHDDAINVSGLLHVRRDPKVNRNTLRGRDAS